jgi:penicillin amidase
MKRLKRILILTLIVLVLLILIGFSFIRHISVRALPDYNADLELTGLHAPVEVYRDSFAIPHVYAQNEHDLYMAVGYLLAQDRLWQMDMLRHVTEGRLSEIFGADYTNTDLLLRALRFSEKSKEILALSDSASLLAINAFCDGINQYMTDNERQFPVEFAILRYKPEKWEPSHTLNMIGYMAWDLKAGWSEIFLAELQKELDSIRYQQILPNLLRLQPTVFPLDHTGSFSSLLPDKLLQSAGLQHLGADVLDGSNNWAVAGSKSVTGKPLLANDMHLGLGVPGIWYQMHQIIPGKLNVTGLVLPGTPVVICGHNDSIAWGMTNTYVDNLDFYEEKLNPDDSGMYEYNGEWRKFEVIKTVIRISDGTQVEKTLQFSHRGPVVSSFKKMSQGVVTMHWVGDEASDEFRTIRMLNRANNWKDFTNALKTFTSISQNIAYADVRGNIGLYCAAGVPIRKRDITIGILPGNTDEYDWKGYVPFNELPYIYNPVTGYVASANNRTAPLDYPYHIGTWYALPARYSRITELLASGDKFSTEDFKQIQLDQHSAMAKKYMPLILNALDKYSTSATNETRAIALLKKWDYNMSANSIAASVFDVFYLQLMECVFADEMKEGLFRSFNGISSISRNALDQLMESRSSVWFDDVATKDKTELLDDMITCAFSQAIVRLGEKYGDEMDNWEWGKIHRVLFAHPLSKVKALDRSLNLSRGPYPAGGSFHTVSPFGYNPNDPFIADHGASHRHIFDLSNWDNSFTVIPTGNSGIPTSKHYCDQTEMYISGDYHKDHFSREKVVANARYHMTFNLGD